MPSIVNFHNAIKLIAVHDKETVAIGSGMYDFIFNRDITKRRFVCNRMAHHDYPIRKSLQCHV